MELPSKVELETAQKSIFSDYQYLSINQEPTLVKWAYPPMYKTSQTGGVLYWRVGFDGTTEELVTEHGYQTTSTGNSGKMQVDRLRLYTNNLNKNILDKAIQDAYRAYQDKYKEGYT